MKKNLFLLFALALGALVSLNSCGDTDPCANKDCVNGECFEGSCECDPGYEYDADGNCTVETREKLLGKYATDEQCPGDPAPIHYEITLDKNASSVPVINIYNFFNAYATTAVTATVGSANDITIATQKPSPDVEVSGSGTYALVGTKMTITLTYTVKDLSTGGSTTCTNTVFTHL